MTRDTALHWSPAPGVHPAQVDEDLVLLDLTADRYLCLPGGPGGPTWDAAARRLHLPDPALSEALAAAGLVRPFEEGLVTAPASPPPLDSAVPDRAGALRRPDLAPLVRAVADHALGYRGRSVSQLIAAAGRGRPAAAGAETVLAVTAAFHRWLPYAPVPAKCLVRSFLLLLALHRAGGDAAWVFGVKTWPFRAHCWLQLDGTVLDDDVETVRAYVPILVA